MAVNINVPSQVRTFANLAAFPASGALKTIYIAEDTNKTYRWTGSVYVEVSAAGASGITIGTTAIASGTVGRVLFEGTGNVVQESANLFWDNTNGRLGIGTSSPVRTLDVQATQPVVRVLSTTNTNASAVQLSNFAGDFWIGRENSAGNTFGMSAPAYAGVINARGNYPLYIGRNDFNNITISTNNNVLINTTTDAGFRLDVNGTARVQGNTTITSADVANPDVGPPAFNIFNGTFSKFNVVYNAAGCRVNMFGTSTQGLRIDTGSNNAITAIGGGGLSVNSPSNNLTISGNAFLLNTAGSERIRILGTGNVLINTTTDAGFKLDVNGTVRSNSTITGNNLTSVANVLVGAILYGTNFSIATNGQTSFGAGGFNAPASALVAVTSTTQGFLPPRMTTTQKNAIASPATGLQIFDTTLNRPCFYDGTTWITL